MQMPHIIYEGIGALLVFLEGSRTNTSMDRKRELCIENNKV